jgi:ureidoacrylate peracid hydrolase
MSDPLLPLDIKLDPRRSALVVIDVQNDFCTEGGYMSREQQDLTLVDTMLPRLRRLVAQAREAGVRVIWVQSAYGTEGNWFLSPVWLDRAARSMRGGHIAYRVCEPGTWGAQLCDGFGPEDQSQELLITKHRYSAFYQTELEVVLRAQGITTVVMTGVSTNTCVESTSRDGFMRDFYVVLAEDCCATYSQAEHDATLWNISKYFGQVMPSREIADVWLRPKADDAGHIPVASEAR